MYSEITTLVYIGINNSLDKKDFYEKEAFSCTKYNGFGINM